MAAKNKSGGERQSETLKLRYFIMNLIYRAGHDSVMVPSSRRLAEQFGLARSTVQLALEKLIRDGFLFSRAGIGTFSNPARSFAFSGDTPPPLIGIVWGDGKTFFQDHYICRQLAPIGIHITENGWNVRLLTLSASSPEALKDEIGQSHLDGLVWVFPDPDEAETMTKIAGLPVVTVPLCPCDANLNSVASDFDRAGRRLGERFLAENRRRLLFAVSGRRLISSLDGIRAAYAESGTDFTATVLSDNPATLREELDRALSSAVPPDALFINGRHAGAVMALLRRHRLDPVRQCRVTALQHIPSGQEFHGLLLEEKHDAVGATVAAALRRLLAEPGLTAEQQLVPVDVIEMTTSQT